MNTIKLMIWDWPLRLFHWLLVVAVVGAYITGELGGSLTEWHDYLGRLALGLLVFRLIWGFIGSYYARFVNFFPTPARLITYFHGGWHGAGHNPLGALSIIALLLLLVGLVVTGLFANDDIAFEGPLFNLIDKSLSDQLSGWHAGLVNGLLGLLALHVGAILFYLLIKKTNLIAPMLTGSKPLLANDRLIPNGRVGSLRIIIALFFSMLVVWGLWSGEMVDYLASLLG